MKSIRQVVAVACVALTACQTTEPVSTQFSSQTKNDAEKFAFVRVRQLSALAEQCQSVSESLFKLSQTAAANWHQRNDATLAAVNAAYMKDVADLQGSLGTVKGQLPSLKFLMETTEQVNADIRDRVLTSSSKERTCERRLQEFNSESGDLVGHPQYGVVFAQLKKDFPAAALPKKLPDLSVAYVPQRNTGRSMYSVELTLKEKNCQPLTVFNLESNWPNELYAASCVQNNVENYYLVHCEWEQCKFGPEKE